MTARMARKNIYESIYKNLFKFKEIIGLYNTKNEDEMNKIDVHNLIEEYYRLILKFENLLYILKFLVKIGLCLNIKKIFIAIKKTHI